MKPLTLHTYSLSEMTFEPHCRLFANWGFQAGKGYWLLTLKLSLLIQRPIIYAHDDMWVLIKAVPKVWKGKRKFIKVFSWNEGVKLNTCLSFICFPNPKFQTAETERAWGTELEVSETAISDWAGSDIHREQHSGEENQDSSAAVVLLARARGFNSILASKSSSNHPLSILFTLNTCYLQNKNLHFT